MVMPYCSNETILLYQTEKSITDIFKNNKSCVELYLDIQFGINAVDCLCIND